MDPPQPPVAPTPQPLAAAGTATHLNYPDSIDSSPRSRQADTWDEPLAQVPGAKLRLMCSYGGHIIPRPHDKSLCYVGGDTRIIVIDRNSSLSSLSARLSRTLLHGRQFTLKYQLPNEDLDSLVSVTTDEDLDNMVEEYDRINLSSSPHKPTRLRLFLFLSKPETTASMGSLLDDAKSETWFVDALNGTGLNLPRNLSDSAAIDNLLEFDDVETGRNDVEMRTDSSSIMVEMNSSFGSSSSSPSMANLPPIKVRVMEDGAGGGRLQDQMAGLDEQLGNMSVAPPPPLPVMIGVPAGVGHGGGEHLGRVVSDDERSDHGAPSSGFRKPPLPLQPVQRKVGYDGYALPSPDSKLAAGFNLPSPDSVASDSSMASGNRETTTPPPAAQITANNNISDPSFQIQMQQQVIPDSMYVQQPQPVQPNQQQQQQQQVPDSNYMQQPLQVQQNQQQRQQQQVQDSMYMQQPLQVQQNQQQQQQQQVQDSMYAQPPQQVQPNQQQHQQQQQQQQQHVQDSMYAQPPQQVQPNQQQQQQQHVQDSMYAQSLQMQPNQQQQQFYHTTRTQYINQPVPISSYYPIYASPSQQMDQQYPMYFMPMSQNQPYNNLTSLPSNIVTDATSTAYKEATSQPIYTTKIAIPTNKPEMATTAASAVYRTATPTMLQAPSNQFQQQYVNVSQMSHQPPPPPSQAINAGNYGYEYAQPTHDQVYYTQNSVAQALPPQYQTMTPSSAVLLSQASVQQQATENAKQ